MQLTGDWLVTGTIRTVPNDHRPLTPEEFAALMVPLGPFERAPVLAVAVSGGPDSLALALLAHRWAKTLDGRVIGLTVDHGLRAASTSEAMQTAAWLAVHDIEHHCLPWEGPKPETGIPRHAREARYRLLGDWCRSAGVLHLLTGHHRGDQAETLAMRKTRGSGPDGLAAIAAIRELPGLRIVRPLLGVDKARLIASLRAMGQAWFDDPSNLSTRFARGRLRRTGLDIEALSDETTRRGLARAAADRRLAAWLARHVTIDPAGFARLPDEAFAALPGDLAGRVVERLVMMVGGDVYPPRQARLLRLIGAMAAGGEGFRGRTLANCRILKTKRGWLICREMTVDARSLPLRPGEWTFWDGRFALRLAATRPRRRRWHARALGEDGWASRRILMQKTGKRAVPAAARLSLPSIWQDGRLVAVPHLGLFDPECAPGVFELHFRPAMPLANAPFAAHICCR